MVLGLLQLIVLPDVSWQVGTVGAEQSVVVLLFFSCIGILSSFPVRVQVDALDAGVSLRSLLVVEEVVVLILVDAENSVRAEPGSFGGSHVGCSIVVVFGFDVFF